MVGTGQVVIYLVFCILFLLVADSGDVIMDGGSLVNMKGMWSTLFNDLRRACIAASLIEE